MSAAYTVAPIDEAQVGMAYLLVRLSVPDMEMEDWRRVCSPGAHTFVDGAVWDVRAVLVATGPRGYVHGLAVIGAARDLDRGTRVELPAFLALSAVDPEGVAAAMLHALVDRYGDGGGGTLRLLVSRIDAATAAVMDRAVAALAAELPRPEVVLELPPDVAEHTEGAPRPKHSTDPRRPK